MTLWIIKSEVLNYGLVDTSKNIALLMFVTKKDNSGFLLLTCGFGEERGGFDSRNHKTENNFLSKIGFYLKKNIPNLHMSTHMGDLYINFKQLSLFF